MSAKVTLILALALLCSCSMMEEPAKPHVPKEFPRQEVILGTQVLTKVFDQEIHSLKCVPDTDEASLLLRTIRPRLDVIQDDFEAMLDQEAQVNELINTCQKECLCAYVDDLLREHLVTLTKPQRKALNAKKADKETQLCQAKAVENFCHSDLYKELDKEKAEF